MNKYVQIASVITCIASLPALSYGQTAPSREGAAQTTLRISAHGEVSVPPDIATMTAGVETTAPSAAEAGRSNALRMTKVLDALRSAGVPDRDIQTTQLSLAPQYAYEAGAPPRLTGYQASNLVEVKVRDLTIVGRLADLVVAGGATNLSQIDLGLANPVAAEDSARAAAVKSLEDKAALYTHLAGFASSRLVSLSEGSADGVVGPAPMAMMAAKAVTATPVENGEVTVRVQINGVFELER